MIWFLIYLFTLEIKSLPRRQLANNAKQKGSADKGALPFERLLVPHSPIIDSFLLYT
jgi:hypothetical protein